MPRRRRLCRCVVLVTRLWRHLLPRTDITWPEWLRSRSPAGRRFAILPFGRYAGRNGGGVHMRARLARGVWRLQGAHIALNWSLVLSLGVSLAVGALLWRSS